MWLLFSTNHIFIYYNLQLTIPEVIMRFLLTFSTVFVLAFACNVMAAGQQPQPKSDLAWDVMAEWQLSEKPIDFVHSLDGKYVFVLTDQQKIFIYQQDGTLKGSIPVDKGVSKIDVSPYGEKLYIINNQKNSFATIDVSFIKEIDITNSPFKGPADAPVTIVLFTDFECPYCKRMAPVLDQLLSQNGQTVKLVLKNLPLQMHKMAKPAAKAAIAADNQGKFWAFHDKLFALKKVTNEAIEKIAADLQLDIEKWRADMNSDFVAQKIEKDISDAMKAEVNSTPTLYINGKLVLSQYSRSIQGLQFLVNKEISKLTEESKQN